MIRRCTPLLLVMSGALMAQPSSTGPEVLPAGGNLLAMTGALLLVVVLVFATGWVVRRFMSGRIAGRGGGSLRVVEQLPVGARERLVVIDFGPHRLLLAMVPGRISRIDSIDRSQQETFSVPMPPADGERS
ncbi:MAG: flagellar biosynthetic protein FliO [Wenzhouxiangellaceae bacterium]|nr:flagellar biosynthetic protein FliO [Wenzhouxiangellaceae bacterium]